MLQANALELNQYPEGTFVQIFILLQIEEYIRMLHVRTYT